MDTNKPKDVPKKCFCARCFLPIDESEKVEIDGQNFHKMCGTCCICRTIPAKLKMFYGHVFCEECFKTFVLARFRGENPQVQVDNWWMQFAPGVKAQDKSGEDAKSKPQTKPESSAPTADPSSPGPEAKRCICARCLQAVEDADKVEIAGQTFHCCCAKCCSCHQVPKDSIKIYCGQVFCEECFHRHILSRNRDNPAEFFKGCFEQWQNNPQFAENMKMFMESSTRGMHAPLVFMAPPPSYRCSAEREAGWAQTAESNARRAGCVALDSKCECEYSPFADPSLQVYASKKLHVPELNIRNFTAATPAVTLDSSIRCPNKTKTMSDPEPNKSVTAAEKIEKLTKYLRETSNYTEIPKKWKTIEDSSPAPEAESAKWQRPNMMSKLNCPKCMWQSGTIYVNRD